MLFKLIIFSSISWMAVYLFKKQSARALFLKGDQHFRKTLDSWLANGQLVESAATRDSIQAEFNRLAILYFIFSLN